MTEWPPGVGTGLTSQAAYRQTGTSFLAVIVVMDAGHICFHGHLNEQYADSQGLWWHCWANKASTLSWSAAASLGCPKHPALSTVCVNPDFCLCSVGLSKLGALPGVEYCVFSSVLPSLIEPYLGCLLSFLIKNGTRIYLLMIMACLPNWNWWWWLFKLSWIFLVIDNMYFEQCYRVSFPFNN